MFFRNRLTLLLIFLVLPGLSRSAEVPRVAFFFGYGFYEGLTAGGTWHAKAGKHSISASAGYEKFLKPGSETRSLSLSWNVALFRKHINSEGAYKWNLDNKLIYWQLNDPYYEWKVLSINPAIRRRFQLLKKLDATVDVGPSVNFVLYNRRKTFKEVGWPYHVLPNIRLLFHF